MKTKGVGRPTLDADTLSARKRAILHEALLLVADRGANNVRLRDVAEAAGVSVGTLQHYFDSRHQLMREAFAQHAYGVIDSVMSGGDQSEDPWGWLETFLTSIVRNPHYPRRSSLWMEFAGVSMRDEDMRQLMAEVYESWREPVSGVVLAGGKAGIFRLAMGAPATTASILALIDGFEMATALKVGQTEADTLAIEMVAAVRTLVGYSPSLD